MYEFRAEFGPAHTVDEGRPMETLGNEICSFENFASVSIQNDLRIRPRSEELLGEMLPSSIVTVTKLSQEGHFCNELEVGLGPSESRKSKQHHLQLKPTGEKS